MNHRKQLSDDCEKLNQNEALVESLYLQYQESIHKINTNSSATPLESRLALTYLFRSLYGSTEVPLELVFIREELHRERIKPEKENNEEL